MSAISFFIIVATVITLGLTLAGSLSMAKAGPCDGHRSASLMGAKVGVQAIAISMIVIAGFFWN